MSAYTALFLAVKSTKKLIDEAVAEERERCAKIALDYQLPSDEELLEQGYDPSGIESWEIASADIADAIRA
jgi:hypothetical protein